MTRNRSLRDRCRIRVVTVAVAVVVAVAGGAPGAVAGGWVSVPGSTPGELQSVSCVAATDCFAVGYITFPSANGYTSRAARWDGAHWTVQALPRTTTPHETQLNGVSCISADLCIAVGDDSVPGIGTVPFTQTTLGEQWNGTAWTLQPTVNELGANSTGLDSVSCPSVTVCIAVGWSAPPASGFNGPVATSNPTPFSERWNGSGWETLPTPAGGSVLGSVSCTSPTACTAVGSDGPDALIERWNGSGWSVQQAAIPSGSHGDLLTGVSCTAPAACTAVGSYNPTADAFPVAPLAESWDGSRWTVRRTLIPGGITRGQLAPNGGWLASVSCRSAFDCVAAGSSTRLQGFGETWNGAIWTFHSFPGPKSAADAVSCGSPTTCLSVGGGFSNTAAIYSTLLAANRFTVQRDKVRRDGTITLTVKLPGPGTLDALATAWDDNFSPAPDVFSPAPDVASSARLQPAAHRFAFGRIHLTARHAGTLTASMAPTRRGRELVHDHRYRVTLRVWITYTPAGGHPRTIGLSGLHVPACPDPDRDQDCDLT